MGSPSLYYTVWHIVSPSFNYTLSEELDHCKVIIEDLEEEKAEVEKQLAALRLELKKERSQSKLREQVIADLENQIQKVCITISPLTDNQNLK